MEKSTIATVLKVVGIAEAISGVFIALVMMINEMSGIVAFAVLLAAFFSGALIYAVGEIVQRLVNIDNNTAGRVFKAGASGKNMTEAHEDLPSI